MYSIVYVVFLFQISKLSGIPVENLELCKVKPIIILFNIIIHIIIYNHNFQALGLLFKKYCALAMSCTVVG